MAGRRGPKSATTSKVAAGRGLIDTSVVIDWDDATVTRALPDDVAIAAITLAELAAGALLATDVAERARRQARLQQVESLFDPLPFDAACARSYGLVVAAIVAHGRRHRSRVSDLIIAATAHANGLPLVTRNADDLAGLAGLVDVIAI